MGWEYIRLFIAGATAIGFFSFVPTDYVGVRELGSGGYLIYDSTWPRSSLLQRGDITVVEVPLAKLVNENFDGVRNRILLKNIAYAGVLAALIDIDLEAISGLLSESYGKKPKLLTLMDDPAV